MKKYSVEVSSDLFSTMLYFNANEAHITSDYILVIGDLEIKAEDGECFFNLQPTEQQCKTND